MSESDRAFHKSFKSTFSPNDRLLLRNTNGASTKTGTSIPEVVLKSVLSKKNRLDVSSLDRGMEI